MIFVLTNSTLTESIMSKKEEIRKGYTCPICNVNFTRYGMVGMHLRKIHEELKSFDCSHCGAQFTQSRSMNRHIATVHEEKKQFTCPFCNGNYATQASFLSCQWNLIKTFQIVDIIAPITKMTLIFFLRLVKWPKIAVKKSQIFQKF